MTKVIKIADFNAIITKLKLGDKDAFNLLMERFYAVSVKQAKSIVKDFDMAADIALSFWEWLPIGIRLHDPNKASFYTWMMHCVKNRAIDKLKMKRPTIYYSSNAPDIPSHAPSETVISSEIQLQALEDLDEITDRLTPRLNEIFWRLLEGATAEDIAAETGDRLATIQQYIANIRRVIKEVHGVNE